MGLALAAWFIIAPWLAVPFLVLAAFFLFFFRDPDRVAASDADAGTVARGWPGTRRGSRRCRCRTERRVAADQHLPLADERAREPRAGVGACDEGVVHARQVPARVRARRSHRERAQRDLGSTTAASRSSRGRSSACSRVASSAG
ncbi:MAG: hypothetical protein QM736_07860 [Vicinamibacterales bacterium]